MRVTKIISFIHQEPETITSSIEREWLLVDSCVGKGGWQVQPISGCARSTPVVPAFKEFTQTILHNFTEEIPPSGRSSAKTVVASLPFCR